MNYNKARNKAYKALQKNGTVCKLIKAGTETYNPLTNKYESETVEYNGVALVSRFDMNIVDGTVIKMDDVNVMAVLDGEPVTGDTLKINTDEYKVIFVRPFSPDGKTVIYYNIQGR